MSGDTCQLCEGVTTPNNRWTLRLSDEKQKIEFSGHKKCVDELQTKMNKIKDFEKKSVKKILSELNMDGYLD